MSLFGTKGDSWRAVLKVNLVGNSDKQRNEVKTALNAIADPKLEVTEMPVPGVSHNGNGKQTGTGSETDVLMVMLNENEEATLLELQRLGRMAPRPALFALLPQQAPGLVRRAVRAGADEVLFFPFSPGDASRALIKVAETKRRFQRHTGGSIWSVSSLAGGIGVTSVSLNLALALRYQLERRVAIVDLDLQKGTMAVALGLKPGHSILALAACDKAPDSLQVEVALTKHDPSLYLLAAPPRIEDCEAITDTVVSVVLDRMREMFDFVIVDTGNHVTEQAVAAWEKSDQLIYLLDHSIGSARCAYRFVDLFDRLQLSAVEPRFVLNRYVARYPVTAEQIAQTLGRPVYARLPRDDKAMERVELTGKDLWTVASSSPLTRSFEELMRMLAQPPTEAPVPRPAGGVSRLVSSMIWRTRGANNEAY